MFFWYFEAKKDCLMLWLQGGPGSSGLIGLFYENGPYEFKNGLKLRDYPWTKQCSLLFVDSPVGTGYSSVQNATQVEKSHPRPLQELYDNWNKNPTCVVEDELSEPPKWTNGFPQNQHAVSHDLIVFLDRFYDLFPIERQHKLYLTGESYAGKYIPSLAYRIDEINQKRELQIPLAGLAIGDGLTDPITQVKSHGQQALQLGFVSKKDQQKMDELAQMAGDYICQGDYWAALDARNYVFEVFHNASGPINYYDVRLDTDYDRSEMYKFLRDPKTLELLHLPPDTVYEKDQNVFQALSKDIMKSAKVYIEKVLDRGYTTILYQANFDFRDGISGSNEYIETLDWQYQQQYNEAKREQFIVNQRVAGYKTQFKNLIRVELLNAGHLAPMDQPEACLAITALLDQTK
ncbi:Alpha/Beta hydrolase protein [Gorgonomyces haynaldii]|nr:Alpha/Beta hydrolase protein [Gorgonomyces haynaldii]